MRKTLLICLVCLLVNLLQAQTFAQATGKISGKVITADAQPAAGVCISIKSTKQTTVTQNDGSFFIASPQGTQTLVINAVGFAAVELQADVNGSATTTIANIYLKETANMLSEVVVTGQYQPQSMRNAVYKIKVITKDYIKMRAATDVAGVLNNELGIRFSTDYTLGETDISLMGMSGQSVKILLDGVPMVDRGSTKQSLSQVDINTIERIEIVEGPMSVVYGTDALAGVINLITKKSTAGSSLGVTARVQEETVGKEYDPFTNKGIHNQNISANWKNKGWNAGASITRNNMGGWQGSYTGRATEWRPKDQWLAGASVGYQTATANIWYRLDYLDETIKVLGDVNPTNTSTDQDYITTRYTHQLQGDYKLNAKWSFNGAAAYQNYERETQTTDIDFATGKRTLNLNLAGGQDVATFKNTFFRGTAQYIISSDVSLQSGVEVKHDQASGQRIKGDPSINDYALFVSAEVKPINGVNIRPGVRFSANSVYDAPPVIPSINTKITLAKDWDLRLSYARGFRAPALRELYFDFHDANHDIDGNENLKAEYSNSFNGAVTWQAISKTTLRYSATVSGFYNQFHDLITTALAGDAANPNLYMYINVDKYKTTGGMLENTITYKNLTATAGFLYVGRYNRYADDPAFKANDLPGFTWSPEVNSNISYNFKKVGVTTGLFYKYTGKTPTYQLIVVDNKETMQLTKTAAFHWADITASKTLGKLITVNAGVKNLFDVTRLQNNSSDGGAHSTSGPILKAAGRSYFLGLSFQWNKN